MKIDDDMKFFFTICNLDWKNFSFEELINGYKLILSLMTDKDSKYYMNMELLGFWVNTFSRILNQFFGIIPDDSAEVCMYSAGRISEIKDKSTDEYTTNDIVVGLSIVIVNTYVERYMNVTDVDSVMTTFYTMFENFYYVEKFCESVNKEIEDFQKGIGVMPS